MSRFTKRKTIINNNELYDGMAEERDVKYFRQYESPNFRYPTVSEMKELTIQKHVWKAGDKYYKLAHEHYGESSLWWVIAWFNKAPTESHVKIGSVVSIPKPIQRVLKYLRND